LAPPPGFPTDVSCYNDYQLDQLVELYDKYNLDKDSYQRDKIVQELATFAPEIASFYGCEVSDDIYDPTFVDSFCNHQYDDLTLFETPDLHYDDEYLQYCHDNNCELNMFIEEDGIAHSFMYRVPAKEPVPVKEPSFSRGSYTVINRAFDYSDVCDISRLFSRHYIPTYDHDLSGFFDDEIPDDPPLRSPSPRNEIIHNRSMGLFGCCERSDLKKVGHIEGAIYFFEHSKFCYDINSRSLV